MTNKKISKIMRRLKRFTNNGTESFKPLDAGGIIENTINFNEPASPHEIEKLTELGLPDSFIEIYKQSNGLRMFGDIFYGDDNNDGIFIGGGAVDIFSVQELARNHQLNESLGIGSELIPVLRIRDVGYIFINMNRLNNEEPYLTYPGIEMDKYFTSSFEDWLEYIIICNGYRFWEFT